MIQVDLTKMLSEKKSGNYNLSFSFNNGVVSLGSSLHINNNDESNENFAKNKVLKGEISKIVEETKQLFGENLIK